MPTAASFVQHLAEMDGNGVTTTSTTLTMSKTVTDGNTIVAGVCGFDAIGTCTATDNLGNTYTQSETVNGTHDAALMYAPVTNAGTLTSITFTHTTTRFRSAQAAEIACGDFVEAGGGTAATGGTTQTPVVNKTLPADGIAVGFTGGNTSQSYTAGAASGTPNATTVLIDAHASSNMSSGLFYALAGAAGNTGFTMNVTTTGTGSYASAGAIFDPIPDPVSPSAPSHLFRNFRG